VSRQAAERLFDRIAAAKADDPLTPVTVIVPNHYAGLWLRRELAQRSYINVRFAVLAQLAETLGAAALGAGGFLPLASATQEAAVREAIRRSGADFGPASDHPSLAPALGRLFTELRRHDLTHDALAALAERGRMASLALAVYSCYLDLLSERGLYDELRLLEAAGAEAQVAARTVSLPGWGLFTFTCSRSYSPRSDVSSTRWRGGRRLKTWLSPGRRWRRTLPSR